MPRTSVAAATAELADRDPVIAKLVGIAGPAKLKRRGKERREDKIQSRVKTKNEGAEAPKNPDPLP